VLSLLGSSWTASP